VKKFLIYLINLIVVIACAAGPTASPTPDPTITPSPTHIPTAIPSPTLEPRLVDLKSGGFSVSVHPELVFDIDDYSINISDRVGKLVISLNGRSYIASSYTLESFLGIYLDEMASRGGIFTQSDPYEIVIDDVNGVAVDITGTFLNDPIAGKAISISPSENFIVFGLAMSNLGTDAKGWDENGSVIFEDLLASMQFKQ